jgi:uncharacterized protein YuzE
MTSVTIGEWIFDSVDYDAEGDVLYLSIGEPRAGYGDETPEGHILRYDAQDEFCGVTLIGVQETLDKRGEVLVRLPPRPQMHEFPRSDLDRALATC